jgi:hypothetical protein
MTIKEFLNIKDDNFTLSNEHLYIYHNNNNELILTHHNKKKFTNPNISHQNSSLAHHFQIPITPNHNNTLIHKDLIIYQEIYEQYETDYLDIYQEIYEQYETDYLDGTYYELKPKIIHQLNIKLHPNPNPIKVKPANPINERLQNIEDRWTEIIYPPHKIKLTERLTDSLITTGNITDMSFSSIYNRLTYLRHDNNEEQVPVMEPPTNIRFTADTWQDQLNIIEHRINNTISKINGGT